MRRFTHRHHPRTTETGYGRPWPGGGRWNFGGVRAVLVLALLAAVALIGWLAARVLMVFFASILLALFLRGVSDWLSRHTRLSPGWALTVTVAGLALLVGVGSWALAPKVTRQGERLGRQLPEAVEKLENQLAKTELGRQLLGSTPRFQKWVSQLPTMISSTLGALVDVIIFLFVGLYLAAEPGRYVGGIKSLFPVTRQQRAGQILCVVGVTLQRWLMGRLLLMAVNAVVTTIGLWLLGVPLPIALGVISGLLNFIPNLGPILAAIPAVLLVLAEHPAHALYVILFYVIYQNIDGYILEPLVQEQTVALPAALTIMSQVLLGVLLGPLGLLLAVPITAAAVVVIKMAYVEDVLGQPVTLPRGA